MLESFTDYAHIFTDGSKDGDKTAATFICQSFEFSKRLPDKASIFTAELEAVVSALRYIKITTKNNKFVVFGDSKSALQYESWHYKMGQLSRLTIRSSVLCVLMVEGMTVVVNVMLSLMNIMNPPPALCNLSVCTVVKSCILGVLALGVSLVS